MAVASSSNSLLSTKTLSSADESCTEVAVSSIISCVLRKRRETVQRLPPLVAMRRIIIFLKVMQVAKE
jgi:hypothetical protein